MNKLTQGLNIEMTYDDLVRVFFSLHDAKTYAGAMQRATGGKVLKHLHENATHAADLVKQKLADIEQAHPEVFAQG